MQHIMPPRSRARSDLQAAATGRRILVLATALIVAVWSPISVEAGVGLPRIGEVEVGPYQVAIHADSPQAAVGSTQLTLAVPDLPAGLTVRLSLTGPDGKTIPVPLHRLRVLDTAAEPEPSAGHGDAGTSAGHGDAGTGAGHGDAGTGVGHGDTSNSQGHSDAAAGDDHGSDEGSLPLDAAYLARGTARFPQAGMWQAHVEILNQASPIASAVAPIRVTDQGPNGPFVATAGLLMAGSVLVGVIGRRRRTPVGGNTR